MKTFIRVHTAQVIVYNIVYYNEKKGCSMPVKYVVNFGHVVKKNMGTHVYVSYVTPCTFEYDSYNDAMDMFDRIRTGKELEYKNVEMLISSMDGKLIHTNVIIEERS